MLRIEAAAMKLQNPLQTLFRSGKIDEKDTPHEVSAFHRFLPQFLSSFAMYLMSYDMGLLLAFPTIIIPSVIGVNKSLNPNETIHMTPDQASWMASIAFIVQPLGNLLSGVLCDALGRKYTILVVNILPLIAWFTLAHSNSLLIVYIIFGILGFGIGLTAAPSIYVSEICEPSIRGILMACAGISTTTGMFMIFLLGSLLPWRQVALICTIIPICNIVVAYFIPETPMWLLSKKRDDEAQKSLQYLRGGVSIESISMELNQLKEVNKLSSACLSCEKQSIKCDHPPPSILSKLTDITHKRTLKPFILITLLFLIMQFSGMMVMRPYIIQILNAHGISFDAGMITVLFGLLGILANICILISIRTLGKRRIYLYSMIGNCICSFGLSAYGFMLFPLGWLSIKTSSEVDNIKEIAGNYSYFAMAMFLIMHFCVSVGISSVPYFLMSEVFPFKSRSFYCGVCGAMNQLFAFIATKTYFDLERLFSLPGVITFYSLIGLVGFFLMLLIMPETEHRSLEDIELHFSNENHKMTDIHIRINDKNDVESNITSNQKFD